MNYARTKPLPLPPEARECIFWGKFSPTTGQCLPLAAHCLDVGLVFRGLCRLDGIRRALDASAGTTLTEQQIERLAVLAMLHDLGKANLGFQFKVFIPGAPPAGHVRELAPLFDDVLLHEAFLRCLPADMPEWFEDDESAYSYFLASFSHHGRPVAFQGEKTGTYFTARSQWWRSQGPWDPFAGIAEIVAWARRAFPLAFKPGGQPLPTAPRFHHRFAGLVMLADWLGSHPSWFPVQRVTLDERLDRSTRAAAVSLQAVGLDASRSRAALAGGPSDFQARFGLKPRPLQALIDDLDPSDDNTRLIIAESETGSGKTEAALNWFFKLFAAGKVDGLYFALPTRVAARELYGRVHRTIEKWFPDPDTRPVTLLAVPGYAQVDGMPAERYLPVEEEAGRVPDSEDLRQERRWAAERPKRFLAAAVAVGTIDQALLSVVQTAHAHLRSVCLDRSLLVVDEVHASDIYMSRLLEALLRHHLAVGGRALLLSATLGARARHRFTQVVAGSVVPLPGAADAAAAPYPSVTLADGLPRPAAGPASRPKSVQFELVPLAFKPQQLAGRLAQALAAGARILVVMNTVSRANDVLRALEAHPDIDPAWLFRCGEVVCPHHGRFAPEDRAVLDVEVSRRLGPGSPAGPLLLIGTQTLEQSLDIDADLMVSDLAPADVLLQRVGRLHRHGRKRPQGCEQARCLVLVPEGDLEAALDERGKVTNTYRRLGYGSVYEDLRALELTRRLLSQQPEVLIPRDNRRLVEGSTHPEHLASLEGRRWALHGQEIEGSDLAQAVHAGLVTALYDRYFGEFQFNEMGGRVRVRLGADNLQLPLDRPFTSPFGQRIREVVIPGHLAPEDPGDHVVVECGHDDAAVLRCGSRRYRYSRYGLEAAP